MDNLIDIVIPVAILAFIVLIVYFIGKFRYQTQKAILEKGGDIETSKKEFPYLEIGLTVLGIGIGLGLAAIFNTTGLSMDTKDLITGACVTIFGGSGLVLAFFIRKKIEK